MDEPLVVVHSRYCAQGDVQLHIKERLTWSGNDFDVFDTESNKQWFKVDGKVRSTSNRKTMEDMAGGVLAQMRHPPMDSFRSRMNVQGPGYSFQVVKKFKFSHEAKAEVTDLLTQKQQTLYMYGNWTARKMLLYLGKKKGGRMLAYCERPLTCSVNDPYELTVLRGTDAALCVILCLAFDQFFNDD